YKSGPPDRTALRFATPRIAIRGLGTCTHATRILVKTRAFFFPFDLFGSAGAADGARLLADAVRELLADNKAERLPTRADAYAGKVVVREFEFATVPAYEDWREQARQAV